MKKVSGYLMQGVGRWETSSGAGVAVQARVMLSGRAQPQCWRKVDGGEVRSERITGAELAGSGQENRGLQLSPGLRKQVRVG